MSELDAVSADLFSVVCNSSAAAVDAFLTSHPTLPVDVQNDKGDTPLIMAARRGDIDVVRTLLKAGASIHTRNLKGSNPLIASAMKGHTDICSLFLAAGADVNQTTDNHTAVCLLLISSGACVDNVDKFGDSMLLDAAKHGNVDVMARLLDRQTISIDRQNKKGDTALIRAAWKGELQALSFLLNRGADVTIRNGNGCTALLMAAMHNHRSCFLALLHHPATPAILSATDDNGNNALFYLASFSPLHSASGTREEPFWEGMNLLIARGISLCTPPNMGNLLLCRAANNGRLDTVSALLDRGLPDVNPNFVDPNNKCRPALLAHLQSQADAAIIRALLEHGASIDSQDTEGNSALILAVRQNLREVVQLLLDHGAKLELETNKGESALSLATQYGDGGCLALLTEKTAEKLGWNALLLHAAQYGDEHKVRHWIGQSRAQDGSEVDLDYADALGRTALMMAARGGHGGCVRLLLAAGVNVRLVDREGCSALVVAIRSGFKDIAEKIARWADEQGAGTGSGTAGRGEWRGRKGEPAVDSRSEMENCTRFLLRLGMRLSTQLDHIHAQRTSPHSTLQHSKMPG